MTESEVPQRIERAFKFVPPERIDILENELIRFSPWIDLNDPFDMDPVLISPSDALKPWPELEAALEPYIDMKDWPAERRHEAVKLHLSKVSSDPNIRSNLRNALHDTLGVLCLTEEFDGPYQHIMWAHYANSHRGFVIEFDVDSDFFASQQNDPRQVKSLCRVNYSEIRPTLEIGSIKGQEDKLVFTKLADWRQEAELRCSAPRQFAALPSKWLFAIPPRAIKGLILGCRADDLLTHKVRMLKNQKRYQHLSIRRAELDSAMYRIHIKSSNE